MIKKNLLHIVSDDKFIDSAFQEFQDSGLFQNVFLIIGRPRKLRFINKSKVFFINSWLFYLIIPFVSCFFSSVIFHSIKNKFEKKLILRINKKTKIHWISWGFDICHLISEEEMISKFPSKTNDKNQINTQVRLPKIDYNSIKWLERVDIISTVLPIEYTLLEQKYNFKKSKYFKWNYSSLEELIPSSFSFKENSKNILLGNSGSIYINHLDAFEVLKSNMSLFESIICPMSYGNKDYIRWIEENGKSVFEDKFNCLKVFLEYNDYLQILSSCDSFVLPSKRQIALGNIILFLYFGKPVFLNEESPTYIFLKSVGIPVFTINEFPVSNYFFDLNHIRNELSKIWGRSEKIISLNRLYKLI